MKSPCIKQKIVCFPDTETLQCPPFSKIGEESADQICQLAKMISSTFSQPEPTFRYKYRYGANTESKQKKSPLIRFANSLKCSLQLPVNLNRLSDKDTNRNKKKTGKMQLEILIQIQQKIQIQINIFLKIILDLTMVNSICFKLVEKSN